MKPTNLLTSLFQYKTWANAGILESMKAFDHSTQAQERNIAIRILNHTYVVDQIFTANLQGLRHPFTATNTKETPSLEQLAAAITKSDQWYLHYVASLEAERLAESLDFTFTDGDPGRMTREEMLTHVALHGGYHRGAIGQIMKQVSITPSRDLFTAYLHISEGSARRRVA